MESDKRTYEFSIFTGYKHLTNSFGYKSAVVTIPYGMRNTTKMKIKLASSGFQIKVFDQSLTIIPDHTFSFKNQPKSFNIRPIEIDNGPRR